LLKLEHLKFESNATPKEGDIKNLSS